MNPSNPSQKSKPDFIPQGPTEWYSPLQLLDTGLQSVWAQLFGKYADQREVQAALDQNHAQSHFSLAHLDEAWVDYTADLGDGFNPTYTIAHLLSQDSLKLNEEHFPRAHALILGGDQVYPTPSREAYKNRLTGPYSAAFPYNEHDIQSMPLMFAIPGNHDWYDGLGSFTKVFCQQRYIGHWQTKQRRSYFALELPHGVWVFGIDVQLNSDIDRAQKDYFVNLIQNHLPHNARVILCTAEPTWINNTNTAYDEHHNLRYFESLIESTALHKQIKTALVLAGDLHHYAHYESASGIHRITAGGGGAFTHPTHHLPFKIIEASQEEAHLKACFPSQSQSKKMLWGNILFLFKNSDFAVFWGLLYAGFGWFMNTSLYIPGKLGLKTPFLLLSLLLICIFLTLFADALAIRPRKPSWVYKGFGFLHGVAHGALILAAYSWNNGCSTQMCLPSILAKMFLIGALASTFLFGLYLILSQWIFKNHDNEAFSALKSSAYKCFVRIHITQDAIRIYPFGIKKTPQWLWNSNLRKFETSQKLNVELIEKGIEIPFKK